MTCKAIANASPPATRWRLLILPAVLLACSWWTPSRAQPVDWVKVKTAAFNMYLPKAWQFFGKKKEGEKVKWAGAWTFGSADGKAKLLVRVVKGEAADLKKAFTAGLARLRKLVKDLKGPDDLSVDNNDQFKIGVATGMLSGKMGLPDPKTKENKTVDVSIARLEQRYRESKVAVTLTYLFAGDHQGELLGFMNTHQLHFRLPIAKEAMRLAKFMAKAMAAEQAKAKAAEKSSSSSGK